MPNINLEAIVSPPQQAIVQVRGASTSVDLYNQGHAIVLDRVIAVTYLVGSIRDLRLFLAEATLALDVAEG